MKGRPMHAAVVVAGALLGACSPPDPGVGDGGLPDPLPGFSARLRLVTLDDESDAPLPSRAIITAVPPTPPVRFDQPSHPRGLGADGFPLAPGVVGAPEGVLLVAGDATVPLPPGTYDVLLTHGPEWEASTGRVTVAAGRLETLVGRLRHSVDTRGWLAADMHVHTGRSFDSFIDLGDRVISEVAVGVELIVTTDHNVATDLQPEVESLGYQQLARAIVGDEFNFAEGHGGVYPVPYDPRTADGGLSLIGLDYPTVRSITGGAMFDRLHQLPTQPAVTVNHPRLPPDLGYFLNIGWAPPNLLGTAGRFDAFEVLNGYMSEPGELAVLLRDWFFLLSSGVRVAALGNSDTHRLVGVKAGFPRTWLRVPTEDLALLGDSELGRAIRGGRAVASNGPFAELRVDGAAIGDLKTNTSGLVEIDAVVDAPGWIDVDTVRVYVGGQKVQEFALASETRPRFQRRWQQAIPPGDTWIALVASGSRPLPPALIGEQQDGRVTPFALTNPVFVDGDGDGQWQPRIADPDPGPLGPAAAPLLDLREGPWRPPPEDCEPPLGTDPSSWR